MKVKRLAIVLVLLSASYAVPQTSADTILDGLDRISRIVDIHKQIISNQVAMMGELAKLNDPLVNAIISPRLDSMRAKLKKIDRIRLGKE